MIEKILRWRKDFGLTETPSDLLQLDEEYQELLQAIRLNDRSAITTEWIDLLFVMVQFAHSRRLPIKEAFECVLEANYSKLTDESEPVPPGWSLKPVPAGFVLVDEAGKVRKPSKFKRCDFRADVPHEVPDANSWLSGYVEPEQPEGNTGSH